MRGKADNIYIWTMYQKIILGFASVLGWLPVIWWLAGMGLASLFHEVLEISYFAEFFFWGYVIVTTMVYIIIFGGMAYVFPKFYILPAWGLNLYSFYLSVQKIIFYLIYLEEPDKFYFFESGEDRFHFFTSRDIYLTAIELFFLIILFRPFLFYFQKLIGKFSAGSDYA